MYKAPSSPRQNPLSRSSSPALEASQPQSKRPRLSEEDDEDEDQPLAITARMNILPASRHENGAKPPFSRRGGKGTSAMSAAQTSPLSIPPPSGELLAEMNGQTNSSEIAVKMEEQMDDEQLDRLATGVTVDTAIASSSSSVRLLYSRQSLTFYLTSAVTVPRDESREAICPRTAKRCHPNNTG